MCYDEWVDTYMYIVQGNFAVNIRPLAKNLLSILYKWFWKVENVDYQIDRWDRAFSLTLICLNIVTLIIMQSKIATKNAERIEHDLFVSKIH